MNFQKSNTIKNSIKSSRLPDKLCKNERSRQIVFNTKYTDMPDEMDSIIRNPFKRDYITGSHFQELKERELVRKNEYNPYFKSKSIIIMNTPDSSKSTILLGNESNRRKKLTKDYLFSLSREVDDLSKIRLI
jgi:hypothetical protein